MCSDFLDLVSVFQCFSCFSYSFCLQISSPRTAGLKESLIKSRNSAVLVFSFDTDVFTILLYHTTDDDTHDVYRKTKKGVVSMKKQLLPSMMNYRSTFSFVFRAFISSELKNKSAIYFRMRGQQKSYDRGFSK